MSACALDHVVIRTSDPDALLARVSDLTGLPILRGWTPGGEVHSRGVRFANGPFLDVFAAPEPAPVLLGLAGSVEAAEGEAARRGWRVKVRRDAPVEPSLEPEPWSILMFRKRQGALSGMFVIDYDRAHPSWATQEFSGELLEPQPVQRDGPRLARVWMAADPSADAELPALGLLSAGDPFEGCRPFRAPQTDVVLCEPVGELASVVRLDVEGAPARGEVRLNPNLVLTAG
jgi:hypothetical protein